MNSGVQNTSDIKIEKDILVTIVAMGTFTIIAGFLPPLPEPTSESQWYKREGAPRARVPIIRPKPQALLCATVEKEAVTLSGPRHTQHGAYSPCHSCLAMCDDVE